ncbi:ClpP family protease [uncultured Acetatifactor sp.]|uniref:ClpP family protease n=1 Tax=uncultured Acetatifactor sp. TaxID=1671927 RepID=UPI0026112D92|nr:ATP-dependent Clp protease proteolytic subunit [uncultured Acetatifactor sp.]
MIMTPSLIRETSEGFSRCAIQDEMFQRREIECVGEITEESVYSLILQLRYLASESPDAAVTMFINSPGGSVASGLALYDVMQAVRCPVRTVCTGIAASMAALLFVSGSSRDMLPHARVMIHDPLIPGSIGGTALKIDALAKDLMQARKTTAAIIAAHTGKSLDEVYAKTATDSYFNAEEAVAWGLADRIIHEL